MGAGENRLEPQHCAPAPRTGGCAFQLVRAAGGACCPSGADSPAALTHIPVWMANPVARPSAQGQPVHSGMDRECVWSSAGALASGSTASGKPAAPRSL